MNKTELIQSVSTISDLPKVVAERAVNAFIDSVTKALDQGDSVSLVGFGTFEVRERAARQGRNPQTGKAIDIAASKLPAFKPGKGLKEAVNR